MNIVVPGQVIAVSSSNQSSEDSFLRGHGTYIETTDNEHRLIASVAGIVVRVNKLIRVESLSNAYDGQVGDLVVGRVTAVGASRWTVRLTPHTRSAALPLSGVHLPGGVQRVRTAEDARDMRLYLAQGDLVSAEVHKVQTDGTLLLHTRSTRYGKLENGVVVEVSPSLVPRRKNHYVSVVDGAFELLIGCNGSIWMQRAMPGEPTTVGGQELAELQEERRRQHALEPYTSQERANLARLRAAVECLAVTRTPVTAEAVDTVYQASIDQSLAPASMLEAAIPLTASFRSL